MILFLFFRYFVVRQLLKTSGDSYLKDLINTPNNFLVPPDLRASLGLFDVPDMLSLFGGEPYNLAKAAIDTIIAESETAEGMAVAIQQFIQVNAPSPTFCLLPLGVLVYIHI